MAFNLPPLPFPKEPGTNNPYIATPDEGGGYTVPSGHYFKKKVGDLHLWVPVSESDPLPTDNANIDVALSALRNALLGTGNKTLTDLATALAPLATTEKQEELVSALGEILVQLQAGSPVSVTESVLPEGASTAEKQEALTALIGALDTAAVSDPTAAGAVIALLKGVLERFQAVEGKIEAVRVLLNALTGEDFATQTTLAQILAKMIASPATEAKQDSLATLVGAIEGKLDGVIDGTTPATTKSTGSKVKNAFEIVPSDTTDLAHETIAIYVGFDGDLKVDLVGGDTVTMYNLASGAWHPIAAKKVYATGTTATYILGAYLI